MYTLSHVVYTLERSGLDDANLHHKVCTGPRRPTHYRKKLVIEDNERVWASAHNRGVGKRLPLVCIIHARIKEEGRVALP